MESIPRRNPNKPPGPKEGTEEFRRWIAARINSTRSFVEQLLGITLSTIELVMLRHGMEKAAHHYFSVDDTISFYDEAIGFFLEHAFGLDPYTVFLELRENRELFQEWMRRHQAELHLI